MAEIHRVPIQPIAKGSLTKLWLGVAAAVALGAGLAWAAVPAGVAIETVQAGSGASPAEGDVLFVKYTGKLADGTVFDEWSPPPIPVEGFFPEGSPLFMGNIVPGFREAALQMQKGGKYVIEIPSSKAYGDAPPPGSPVPANADLTFDVELVEFMSEEDFQRRLQALQQVMQMQQEREGGQPGAQLPPPPPGAGPVPPPQQ